MGSFPNIEDIEREIFRKFWLKVLRKKFKELGDSKKDFGRRCNLMRQAYIEMADIVLDAARRGSIAQPYFLPWEQIWRESPPEFRVWQSIRYYGRMPLYPQYPVLNYFLDFGDPWQRIGVEIDSKLYHDEEKDLRRDEELFEIGWKIFRIPTAETSFGCLEPDDEFRELHKDDQQARLSKWLLETSDGVLRALKTIYYERWTPLQYAAWYGLSGSLGAFFVKLCYQTLHRHRLVTRFELPADPNDDGPWKPWREADEP